MISGSGKKFLSPREGVAALGTSAPLHTRGDLTWRGGS